MLNQMKNRDFKIDDEYYTYQEWMFNFPKGDESIPCIDIYVCGY